jgi:hypothetical protein
MGHTIPRTYFGHGPKKSLREGIQRLTGCTIERAYVDKGYRGYDAPDPNPFLLRVLCGTPQAISPSAARGSMSRPMHFDIVGGIIGR